MAVMVQLNAWPHFQHPGLFRSKRLSEKQNKRDSQPILKSVLSVDKYRLVGWLVGWLVRWGVRCLCFS